MKPDASELLKRIEQKKAEATAPERIEPMFTLTFDIHEIGDPVWFLCRKYVSAQPCPSCGCRCRVQDSELRVASGKVAWISIHRNLSDGGPRMLLVYAVKADTVPYEGSDMIHCNIEPEHVSQDRAALEALAKKLNAKAGVEPAPEEGSRG